jgi:C1A family cysteine protease
VKASVPRDPTAFAHYIYQRAKVLDPWEGTDYEGTSVLAGAKAMREAGLIKEFRWCFGIDDVIDAVLTKGPVVLGIYWYESMYDAPEGIVSVSGKIVGGHCITAVGYKLAASSTTGEDCVILQNSWGPDWGKNGLAEIRVSQLDELLKNTGEACVPSKRSYGR